MSQYYRRSSRAFSSRGRNQSHRATPRGLDRSCYVNTVTQALEEEDYTSVNTFKDFLLDDRLVTNIERKGYTQPTPIQDQAIPALMQGRDVVGIAKTGTGKTAAFLLPLIHKIINSPREGVLIVAPTRELALQIFEEFKGFSQGLDLSVSLCIGGTSLYTQMQVLRKNPHFVIGTPGRLIDLIERNAFKTELFSNIVLDEVDRMLDIGFRKDIKFLISKLPIQRQAAFFSATMNRETEEIMRELLTDPVKISVKTQESHNHIHQDVIRVRPGENKVTVLHQLLIQEEYSRVIVFGRTKHGINKLEQQLFERGIQVTSIHGNKNQNARQRSLESFKRGRVQALLATDIAARGIDIDDVSHVINYDEPQSYEDYIHRIGRTGRAGKHGKAITFIS